MTLTVGTFEAKTKFSQLIDKVEQGEEIVVTRRGKVVAKIVSPDALPPKRKKATVEELLEIGRALNRHVVGEFTSADIDKILYDEDGLPK